MKKFINVLTCIILLITGCKKEITEEIQGPAEFELKLAQTNITVKTGQTSKIGAVLYKNQIPLKNDLVTMSGLKFEVIENTTEDNVYGFNDYNVNVIEMLAPQKPGLLKVKVTAYVNGVRKGEAVLLTINVEYAPINYTVLDKWSALLNHQIQTNQNEIIFSNGVVYNQSTSTSKKIEFKIPENIYGYYFTGLTSTNDFILIDYENGGVSTYNPINQNFSIKSDKINFTRAFVFRDIVIGNKPWQMGDDIFRVKSNNIIDYLGYDKILNIIENDEGFYLYKTQTIVDYPTDTSTLGISYPLPVYADFIKRVNGIYYLVGEREIYSSTNGKDNWVKIGSIPTMPNGSGVKVYMNSNAFFFYSSYQNIIYKSQSLTNLTLSTINAPMEFSFILPLDNGSIIFNSSSFNFMGIFTP